MLELFMISSCTCISKLSQLKMIQSFEEEHEKSQRSYLSPTVYFFYQHHISHISNYLAEFLAFPDKLLSCIAFEIHVLREKGKPGLFILCVTCSAVVVIF